MQLGALVLDLVEKVQSVKHVVNRTVIHSFGRSAKAILPGLEGTHSPVREKPEVFRAGDKVVKNYVKRSGLHSKVLHGEADSVDPDKVKEGLEEVRAA